MLRMCLIALVVTFGQLFQPLCSLAIGQGEPQFNGRAQEVVSESSTWENGVSVFRESKRFDQQGRIVETEIAFLKIVNGEMKMDPPSIGKWFYDKKDRHVKTVFSGSIDMVITRSYDDRGNQIDHTSFDKDGRVRVKFVFSYDADGNNIESRSFNRNGQLLKQVVNEYDDVHRLINSVGFNADGSVEYRIVEKYDRESMSKVSLVYKSGVLDEKVTSMYLDNGLIAEETRYKVNESVSSRQVYSYEYDEKGNWTKQTSTQLIAKMGETLPQPPTITRRTIKYY